MSLQLAAPASIAIILVLGCSAAIAQTPNADTNPSASVDFFEKHIRPVLSTQCYSCHSERAAEVEGGLRLDSREHLRTGGDSGSAIRPGEPTQSILIQRLTSETDPMPPDGNLPLEVIERFRSWVAAGAYDPRNVPDTQLVEPDYANARQHWAYQPIQRTFGSDVRHATSWSRSPIDEFVSAKLNSVGLQPSFPAKPQVLIRRLYFDLLGLPPTPAQVAEYCRDPSDEQYARIVDKLLSSPQFGQRQAQHWLDVVRYAESEGFEYDRTLPDAWRYRDYVIAAFNSDKTFDRFLEEQIAGDELDPPHTQARIAAGFHRLGAVRRNAGNQMVASSRDEVLTERTDIVGSVFLGLTIGCARCHDHKFDAIPQQDYFRLKAFFAASHEYNYPLINSDDDAKREQLRENLEKQIAELKAVIANLDGEEETQARKRLAGLQDQLPPLGPSICSVRNRPEDVWPIQVLRRGDPNLGGPPVGMRAPGILVAEQTPELPLDTLKPRSILAEQLISDFQPLTARVIANRVWQWHFGAGLVNTPNDFGNNGAAPSHPELLDFLASELLSGGWSLKRLHRQIVLSNVYRQSSGPPTEQQHSVDPDNRFLSHFPRRRLSGEEIRDAMLSMSDQLHLQSDGPSVMLPVDPGLVEQLYAPDQWQVSQELRDQGRRSVYLFAKRNLRFPFLEVFDQPSSQTSCAVRAQSTHAGQALELLNGQLANSLAASFAERLNRESGEDREDLVTLAFLYTSARPPTGKEMELSLSFLQHADAEEFALAMFNVNSFLYVE